MATEQMLVLTWRKRDEQSQWLIHMEADSGRTFNVSIGPDGTTSAGPRLKTLLAHMEEETGYYPLVFDMQHIPERADRLMNVQLLNEVPAFIEASVDLLNGVQATFRPIPYKPVEETVDILSEDEAEAFLQPWQHKVEEDDEPEVQVMSMMSTMSVQTEDPVMASSSQAESQTSVTHERVGDQHRYWVFMRSSTVNVSDGGSLSGYIDGFYWPNNRDVPDRIGDQRLGVQQMTVDVEYVGVEPFGTTVKSNEEKSVFYGVSPHNLHSVGLEALSYNRQLIKDHTMIAISLQYSTALNRPVAADSGALMGVAYATNYTSFDEVRSAVSSGSFKGININTSLLKEPYSYAHRIKAQNDTAPYLNLVEFTGFHKSSPSHGIKTSDWARQFGLQEPPTQRTYNEHKRAVENMADTTEVQLEGIFERVVSGLDKGQAVGSEEIKARDFINNDLAFVPAKDDRIESGELYSRGRVVEDEDDVSEDLPYDYLHRVRIGDSVFEVPPLSIQVDKQHRNEKVQAMRTKTSMQKQIGYVQNVITMELYFHDLENINGRRVHAYTKSNGEHVYYYLDGLRSLLAQFKKTPFLPVDNDYINNSLNINNVALTSVSAQTVDGFPEALQVTLVLEEIEVGSFLMGTQTLGEVMNYPLMRWYYQQALQQPHVYEPWKTYLPTIDYLDNAFSFRIVDEFALKKRADLIHEFRQMKVPARMKEELEDQKKNDDAYKYFDAGYAETAVAQYDRFMAAYRNGTQRENVRVPANLRSSYSAPYNTPVFPHNYAYEGALKHIENEFDPDYVPPIHQNADGSSQYQTRSSIESELAVARNMAKHLYGIYAPNPEISNHPTPFFKTGTGAAFYTLRTAMTNSEIAEEWLSRGNAPRQALKKVIKDHNLPGFFILRVRDTENVRVIQDLQTRYQALTGTFLYQSTESHTDGQKKDIVYLLPAGTVGGIDFLNAVRRISEKVDSIDKQIEDYTFRYNALAAEINKTEENMPMVDFPIHDLIPLSLNVSLHNNFSNVQVQAAESPTKQFLGAQEPQVVVAFETTEYGVKRIDTLMRTVAQYAKQYREGMVSGFMDIKNPLVNLFGITSVLPETVQFSTVPGHPDRKMVTLGFVGFDKSQRRQEALYGFVGAPTTPELREIAFGNRNYDPNMTPMFTHEKMRHMELYPDLELPTIAQLNEALPHLGAGIAGNKWENRTNQIYLDPDFYISTNGTYRKYIKDLLDDMDGIDFRWEDETGMSMDTSSKEGESFKMSAADRKAFEKAVKETEYVDPETHWEGWQENGIDTMLNEMGSRRDGDPVVGGAAPPPVSYNASDVEQYVAGDDWMTIPPFNEWRGNNSSGAMNEYTQTRDGKNPSPAEVWLHLAKAIRKSFSDTKLLFAPMEEGVLDKGRNDGGVAITPYYSLSGTVDYKRVDMGQRTWMTPLEFYWSDYPHQIGANKLLQNHLENGNEAHLRKIAGMDGRMARLFDHTTIWLTGRQMPFMRVMMYMKHILTLDSNWRAVDEDGQPIVSQVRPDGAPWRVGIMGADLSKASSKQEAQRLLWDWRYNIDFAVNQMADIYKKAEESDFHEIQIRRLDWAIASHSGAQLPPILFSNDESDDKPFGATNDPISPDIFPYFNAIDNRFKRDALHANSENAQGIYLDGEGQMIDRIFNLYNDQKHRNERDLQKERDRQKVQTSNNMTLWTNQDKLKGMYVDMYHYDQTGRMLRAFPSFSMQLIDEGKWYRNFRTWDNFYGYNALNSIDVYKSRKIAADTAVIEMSNMYGGLTGMRHDMKHFDFRMPSFFSAQFWTYYVWGSPTDEVLDERAQIYETIMLQPGARIQLRMGYGADAHGLPIVFNGVITEVNADEIVEIQAQSDALELTNAIGGNPDDDNKRFGQIQEPSEYIGRLMTTKGNWIRDLINDASNGTFFKESPMGIAHFGASHEGVRGNWLPFTDETYGESMQNVYAQSSRIGSEAQKHGWMDEKGVTVGQIQRGIDRIAEYIPGTPFRSASDEDNILIPVYGMTIWEIINTFALCSIDYVTDVVPFEYRSSLFFGRPHWPMTYAYDSKFVYDKSSEEVRREITYQHKKTFMQAHVYCSQYNILSNNIRASEEGVYNNVIVEYDGRTVGPMQADNDIRYDRQRTAQVQAQILSRSRLANTNYMTSEAQAQVYGMSTVRDFMKDMYKGSYSVIGDATVKPYDINYLGDTVLDMQGIHLVKAVHHSMSVAHGFVSHIEPDAYVVNFDQELLYLPDKVFAIGKNTTVRSIGVGLGVGAFATMVGAPVITKLANMLYPGSKLQTNVNIAVNIKRGVARQILSRSYEQIAAAAGDEAMRALAVSLRDVKRESLAKLVVEQLGHMSDDAIRTASVKYKSAQFMTGVGNKLQAAAPGKMATFNGAVLNKGAVYLEMADNIGDIKRLGALYHKGQVSQIFSGPAATATKKGLLNMGLATKAILLSPLFWTVAITVALNVATSSLVEMWTRRKQNAECIKVIPLQYKGRPFLAAMNGRRGSVVGDDPSLGDKLLHAKFGQDNGEADDVWWGFVPKILNWMEGS